MDNEQLNLLAQFIIAISTFVGVMFAVIGARSAYRQYRMQTLAQMFIHFTKRYHEVRNELPNSANKIFTDVFSGEKFPEESHDALVSYLNLCGEEYYMFQRKLLDEHLWNTWSSDLYIIVAEKGFQDIWEEKLKKHISNSDFVKLIERKILNEI